PVAVSTLARHEKHGRSTNRANDLGVVPGVGRHAAPPGARFNAGSFQSGADLAVEQDAPLVDHLTQPSIQASASAHIANQLTQLLVEVCQYRVIGMPKVDGEGGLARHLVDNSDLVPRLNEDWALLDMVFYECVQILPSRAQDCPRI